MQQTASSLYNRSSATADSSFMVSFGHVAQDFGQLLRALFLYTYAAIIQILRRTSSEIPYLYFGVAFWRKKLSGQLFLQYLACCILRKLLHDPKIRWQFIAWKNWTQIVPEMRKGERCSVLYRIQRSYSKIRDCEDSPLSKPLLQQLSGPVLRSRSPRP